MKPVILLLISTIAFATSVFSNDDKQVIPSVLKSATVYRNAAELVHTAKAFLKQGNNDLVIDDISNTVDVNSIRIKCSGDVTIMSVEFSKEYLKSEIKSPAIKKLEDSLDMIKEALSKIAVAVKSDNDLIELLHANREIRGT